MVKSTSRSSSARSSRALPVEQRPLVARGEDLEVAQADERRRHPAHDGPRLGLGAAVVEHVPDHPLPGGHQAQRAGGGNPQVVHGLAAQELADGRAQHGAAVGGARVWGEARALELDVPAPAVVHDLRQGDGAAVPQLPGPLTELVAAVTRGVGRHPRQHSIARQHLHHLGALHLLRAQPQQLGDLGEPRQQAWGGNPGGRAMAPAHVRRLPRLEMARGVAGQLAGKARLVVESEGRVLNLRWGHGDGRSRAVGHGSGENTDRWRGLPVIQVRTVVIRVASTTAARVYRVRALPTRSCHRHHRGGRSHNRRDVLGWRLIRFTKGNFSGSGGRHP